MSDELKMTRASNKNKDIENSTAKSDGNNLFDTSFISIY